jgi:hypothetical protein
MMLTRRCRQQYSPGSMGSKHYLAASAWWLVNTSHRLTGSKKPSAVSSQPSAIRNFPGLIGSRLSPPSDLLTFLPSRLHTSHLSEATASHGLTVKQVRASDSKELKADGRPLKAPFATPQRSVPPSSHPCAPKPTTRRQPT